MVEKKERILHEVTAAKIWNSYLDLDSTVDEIEGGTQQVKISFERDKIGIKETEKRKSYWTGHSHSRYINSLTEFAIHKT